MKSLRNKSGFTLPEILIAVALLTVIFSGVILTYFRCMELNEISANTSTAVLAAKSKIAEMETTAFNSVDATYNNVPFAVTGLDGMGVSYVDDSTPGILTITTVVGWRQSNGRVFGEDTNLNGQLNGSEDLNGNNRLDSIVTFETQRFDT